MDTVSKPISPATLAPVVGSRAAPLLIDVRKAEAFAESEYFLPGSLRWDYNASAPMPAELANAKHAVAYCVKGAEVGIKGAALLANQNIDSAFLEGGLRDWQAAGFVAVKKRPDLGVDGERVSRWVTRARPKIDRIACPWLIRRFIDPRAEFFFVPTKDVFEFAKANNAVAYDIPGAPLEHNGAACSFDSFLQAFELVPATKPATSEGVAQQAIATFGRVAANRVGDKLAAKPTALEIVANIVRGADTDALRLAPESAGLLAISLGFSRMIDDDHAMLDAMMPVYDALYEWAVQVEQGNIERHSWSS
ncbi:MAG: chromate resistance protein ChrB domain-containing protein [Casimicrobium sp.]